MATRDATKNHASPKALPGVLWAFGPLRIVLFGFALASMLVAPAPGTPARIAGWDLVSTVLAPVLAPLLLMALLLDVLMALLFMSDKAGIARSRYQRIALADTAVALGLLLVWVRYFAALAR